MKMKDTTFVYTAKCHPVTQSLADLICDHTVHVNKLPLHGIVGPAQAFVKGLVAKKSKNYFCESAMSVIVPMTRRHFLGEKNCIVYRGIDGLFYDADKNYLGTKNPIKKWLLRKIIKNIDRVICDSTMVVQDAKKHGKNTALCGSYTFRYDEFRKIKPNLKSNIFITVSDYRPPYDHKGVTDLIEVFNRNGQELWIIGRDTEQLKDRVKNKKIKILGFQNPANYFGKATFYIHWPRYEAGPISVVEAATAGLIPIVNQHTGFKDLVMNVDKKLVVNEKDIAKILQSDLKQRSLISKKARNAAKEYKKDVILKKFKFIFENEVNTHWKLHGHK